jgi:hypothetical protein
MKMNGRIFSFVVCMLMITSTVVPISGSIFAQETSQPLLKRNTQYNEAEKILKDLKIKLNTVTTKQEAFALVKEAIVDLNKYGLLPKGMNVRQAQRLVDRVQLSSIFLRLFDDKKEITAGNANCLVIGITNNTYFRPYPSLIMDIPILYNLAFNSSLRNITCFLALPYLFRTLQPFKFGPYAIIGGRTKFIEQGNITDDISPSSGLILTFGSNGFQKWNGSFHGGLNLNYKKFVYNNDTSLELWDPIGIVGFTGIDFFSTTSFFIGPNHIFQFYVGFAREANFTYSYPWT